MIFTEKKIVLKDGRTALLRSPRADEAEKMLQFIIKASGETGFLMRYPEEFADFTIEKEREFLLKSIEGSNEMMIACYVEGKLAGNCQISFRSGLKDRHRASVAIGLLQEYWNLGIGSRMFQELIRIAEERKEVRQIELEFIEGNSRARALYEKMGFRITGFIPDAIRLKDGTFLNEYMMLKRI